MCLLYCKEKGYMYSGTQYGFECYCGDDPYQHCPDKYVQDYDCDMECYGDSGQMCGGFWRMSVYKTGYLPYKEEKLQYQLISNRTILTSPSNQVLTSRSKVECARYCYISDNCKLFVISTATGQCSLHNNYTVMCDGVQDVQEFKVYLMK
ncbi:uncharacterized protein LOC143081883 [Mytilus galloprovincialis]|uniref:uncharacterized protein LOC143081883 n=1 Tax=Mytilus galloprovincialis TaxID=29158 RepID=UPI003F7B517E